jgi:hypothetical protein
VTKVIAPIKRKRLRRIKFAIPCHILISSERNVKLKIYFDIALLKAGA